MKKSSTFAKIILPLLFISFNTYAQFQQNLSFNGSNNVVDCGNMTSVFENVSTYTVEARVKFNSFTVWGTVLCKRTDDLNRDIVLQCYSSTGQLGVAVSGGYGYTITSVSAGVWHHIAIVYDGNNSSDATRLKLFVNGNLQALTFFGAVPTATPVVAGSRFCLGAEYNGTTAINNSSMTAVPFNGTMDEVRIWDSARTPAEITANMNTELTLPQTNLVAYYQFNQGSACGPNVAQTILNDATGTYPGSLWNFTLNGTTSNFTTVVDTSVSVNNSVLSANASPASYQWYNCTLQSNVIGQNGNSFTPSNSGSYSVIVTQDFCIGTSSCYPIIVSGISESNFDKIIVYPNPINNLNLNLIFKGISEPVEVTFINAIGKEIAKVQMDSQNSTYNTSNLARGIYLVRIQNKKGTVLMVKKLVKE